MYKEKLDMWGAVAEHLARQSERLSDDEWSCTSWNDFNKIYLIYFIEPCEQLKILDDELRNQYIAEVTQERYDSIMGICDALQNTWMFRLSLYCKFKGELEVSKSRDCYE